MEVIDHLKTVALVSPATVFLLYTDINPVLFGLLTIYGVAFGVLIDLDHFLLARLHVGDWRHLKLAIQNPFTITTNCQEVVDGWLGEKGSRNRLITHTLIAVFSTVLGYIFIDWRFAALTGIVLLTHILGDLYIGLIHYWK